MARKKVKVSDFIEAIKRDEIEWYKGGWFKASNKDGDDAGLYSAFDANATVEAACVLGIGCINAGIKNDFSKDKIGYELSVSAIQRKRNLPEIFSKIISFNDGKAQTWEEARDYAVEQLTPYADLAFWSDEFEYNVKRTVGVK